MQAISSANGGWQSRFVVCRKRERSLGFFARCCSRQSCAQVGCGASLQRSHCVSTALRCALSRLHRGTHFVRCALAVRTTAMKMLTKRAARAAVKAVLLGAAEARRSPPGHSIAAGWFVVGAEKTGCLQSPAPVPRVDAGPKIQTIDSRGGAPGSCAGLKTKPLHSRKSVPGGGDLCGGEEASPGHKQSSGLFVSGEQQGLWPGAACKARAGVGARSALRKHSHRGCPSVESEANVASSAVRPQTEHHSAGYTQCDRHSVSPRRVPTSATRAAGKKSQARKSLRRLATPSVYPRNYAYCEPGKFSRSN